MGTAATTTVATLFIIDFVPQEQWDPRISWLQSFNGAGQVAGLLLAGIFGSIYVAAGLRVAAAFALQDSSCSLWRFSPNRKTEAFWRSGALRW
jgi:fucose permease